MTNRQYDSDLSPHSILKLKWSSVFRVLAIGLIIIGVSVLLLLIREGYTYSWTGFAEYTSPSPQYQHAKTLWDWMDLLIVPIVLAGGALWFNLRARQTENAIAESRAETERRIADQQLQEATLQTFLDYMTALLLDRSLRDAGAHEVRDIARVRTVTTLRRLDGKHNTILVNFLRDARLIAPFEAAIDLEGVDLSMVDLSGANLSGFKLPGVNLSNANLTGTDLTGANLNGVNLSSAAMPHSRLCGAELQEANLVNTSLQRADLSGAILRLTNGTKANLLDANLRGADLSYANFSGTCLRGSNLEGAQLKKSDLSQADLRYARLVGCNLNDVNLSGANIRGAFLPD